MSYIALLLVVVFSGAVSAQRFAIVAPVSSANSEAFSSEVSSSLTAAGSKVIDESLSSSVFRSRRIDEPFNLTTAEAKNLTAAIGCEYMLLYRVETVRRASFSRPDYYQAFAVLYLVSARTGRLADWRLISEEAENEAEARQRLYRSVPATMKQILGKLHINTQTERTESVPSIEEVPDENSPAAKGLRPPVPYRRIKPEYTSIASFYNVRATVDILADVSEVGEITRTEIVRWAGFGLDESVISAVRKMNWRPAMRNDKPLPMRVLLRYNFTKVENDQ